MFNVYGPGQDLTNMRQGMVSIFLSQALQSNAILVKGSLDRFRDFIYIDDVVDCWLKGIELKELKNLTGQFRDRRTNRGWSISARNQSSF